MENENTSPSGKIGSAILAIMSELQAIGKDSENKEQHYNFRSVDAVTNALNPLLAKHQVFVRPLKVLHEEVSETKKGAERVRQRIVFRYEHADGSYRDSEVTGEGVDYGDKATNKCMSVAFKYSHCQTFCIRTDDPRDDPDNESPENGPPQERRTAARPAAQNKPNPAAEEAKRQKAALDALVALLKSKGVSGAKAVMPWLLLQLGRKIAKLSDLTPEEYTQAKAAAEKLPAMNEKGAA